MRRRRPFQRRRLLGSLLRRGLQAEPLQALARANRLMEVGQHANAAAIFERLAQEALNHGFERQAPFLLLQAGRARLLAGQTQEGASRLREGLDWLARQGRWLALHRAGSRVVEDLHRMYQGPLAQEISTWLAAKQQGDDLLASQVLPDNDLDRQTVPRPRLPVKCPSCGAPVRPGEVEWFDEISAECAYCGGVMQADE